MSQRPIRVALLSLLGVGLIVGFWLWRKDVPPTSQRQTQPVEQTTELPVVSPIPPTEEKEESLLSKQIKQFVADRDSELNGAVKFYGKVIDQNGQPVSEVTIEGEYSYYVTTEFSGGAAMRDTQEKRGFTVTTDANGAFIFLGIKAINVLFLKFEKEGYALAERQTTGFNFAKRYGGTHQAAPQTPIIFRMWRKGKTEPLIYVEKKISLEPQEPAMSFNWLTGEKWAGTNESADMVIHMERHHSAEVAWFVQQWTMSLSALGSAGLQETSDQYLRSLPENGFTNALQYDSRTVLQQGWSGTGGTQRNYFLQARNGRIAGAIKADIAVGNNGTVTFRYSGYFSTTGSRDLDFDPEKLITDPEEIRRLDETTRSK